MLKKFIMNGMSKTKIKHPFECARCAQYPASDFFHFEPVDDWLIFWPEKKLGHMHFGYSTTSEGQHTEETHWIMECSVKIFKDNPDMGIFLIADMSRSDDSEFPSDESIKLYKELIKNPQVEHVVFYGAATGMSFFLKMLKHVTSHKINAVRSYEDAEALYQRWIKGDLK